MLIFLLFSIVCGQNIILNPSFEEVNSDNKPLHWNLRDDVEISSDSHSGNKSLKFKITNKTTSISQAIKIEKGFQYEICVHFKFINNIKQRLLGFRIQNLNHTPGFYEYYDTRSFSTFKEWKKVCVITAAIKKPVSDSDPYYFVIYSYSAKQNAEGYVDDISMKRINFFIGINNDRDEVYDKINVVYQINGNKENYNISDFELKTRIKDDKKIFKEYNIKITSLFFTNSINIKKIGLKENNYYQVECILKNKKDNITDISSYPFKKINSNIKRNVTYDQYGRMFINDELFFPFGIYTVTTNERELMLINQTHLNIVKNLYTSKKNMDMIYSAKQGNIKIIYGFNVSYISNSLISDLEKEEYFKNNIIDKVNEFKDHPGLLAWYINDEQPYYFNKYFRNITLSIHELDPNHPTYTVIMPYGEMPLLLNTTDIMGVDCYPIGKHPIREVNLLMGKESERPLGKPNIPVIQIFDWSISNETTSGKPEPPTLQEMRSMSWQSLVLGAKGLMLYCIYEIIAMDKISPIEDRWKDIIEFTDEIWKYKDVILSIDKVNKIE